MYYFLQSHILPLNSYHFLVTDVPVMYHIVIQGLQANANIEMNISITESMWKWTVGTLFH